MLEEMEKYIYREREVRGNIYRVERDICSLCYKGRIALFELVKFCHKSQHIL